MQKGIIFGCGFTGKKSFYKLSLIYEIIGYADNNQILWGQHINGVKVMSPKEILNYDCDVIICSDYHKEIRDQLLSMGVQRIRMIEPLGYMLYEYSPKKHMCPVEYPTLYLPYKKISNNMHILFVQQHPCTRTHKIAEMISDRGIEVSIAYIAEPPKYKHSYYAKLYKGRYAFFSAHDLIDFVNESEYDLVHCSNEPDSLTNLMLLTNKPVVHDTHDMMSLCYSLGRDMLNEEYVANVKSHGLIYVNEQNRELAKERFHIDLEKSIVVENRPSDSALVNEKYEKISEIDGKLHCVYEGGIVNDKNDIRFIEEIWMKLAESDVHVHFYTQADPIYCKQIEDLHPNIHYEGMVDSSEIIKELTKYDCGILLFQDRPDSWLLLNTALPNKIFEYLAAGIPSVVGNVKSHRAFVEYYKTGAFLDMDDDIKMQIENISKIQIEDNFIENHQLRMSDQAEKLIEFYKKTIERYRRDNKL